MPLIWDDPNWRRERLMELAQTTTSRMTVVVWDYLASCVCTRDGWTWALTKTRISKDLATSRSVVIEAISGLHTKEIILAARRDETPGRRGQPGRCYQIAHCAYIPAGISYAGDTLGVLPMNDNREYRMLSEHLMNLSAAVDSLLRTNQEDKQQQPDSYGVPPPYDNGDYRIASERKSDNGVLPACDNWDLWTPSEQKRYWLHLAGVGEPALSRLADADDLPPETALAWALEKARWELDNKGYDNPVGMMLHKLGGNAQVPGDVREYAEWLLELDGDEFQAGYAGKTLVEVYRAGFGAGSEYQRSRYTGGDYADYIEH